MYVNNRPVVAIYRLVLSALAAAVLWVQFSTYGTVVWRLFSTWALMLMAVYFLTSAVVTAFYVRRSSGQVICPTWQGVAVVAGLIMLAGNLVIYAHDFIVVDAPSDLWGLVAYFLLPVLALVDWLIFSDKGRWRWGDPFYFLALPTFYAMWILLTAVSMCDSAALRYPYGFLDYNVIGVEMLLMWFLVLGVIILTVGYGLVVLDFVMSGKLSQHVVLPRIKTVVVEEPVEEVVVPAAPQKKVVQGKATNKVTESKATQDKVVTKLPKTPAVPPLVPKSADVAKGGTKKSAGVKAAGNVQAKVLSGNQLKSTNGNQKPANGSAQAKVNQQVNNQSKKIAVSDAAEGVKTDTKSAKKLHMANPKRTKSAQAMHSTKGVGAEAGVKKAPATQKTDDKTEEPREHKPTNQSEKAEKSSQSNESAKAEKAQRQDKSAKPKDKVAEMVEAAVEKAVEELAKNTADAASNEKDLRGKFRTKNPT